MIKPTRGLLLATLLFGGVAACGTSHKGARKPTIVAAQLPQVKADAERAFEEGVRLIGLGPRQFERARVQLERAVEIDGNVFEAWHNLGYLNARQGRWSEAVDVYEKALKLQPGSRATMLGLAESLLKADRAEKAHGLFRKWVAAYPDDAELHLAYIASLREGGEPDDALEEVLKILSRNSNNAQAFNALGLIHRKLGRPSLAETAFRRAAELDAKAAYVWNNLGLLALDRGDDQEAFADFTKATDLDPQYVEALLNKAVVYMDCGSYDRATAELERALKMREGDPDLHVALGVAARGSGKFGKAVAHYEKALELYPDYPPALYNLGVLFMDHQKNNRRARESLLLFRKVASSEDPKMSDVKMRLQELKGSGS